MASAAGVEGWREGELPEWWVETRLSQGQFSQTRTNKGKPYGEKLPNGLLFTLPGTIVG